MPIRIEPELPGDAAAIEDLNDRAFGPDRLAKTAYRLREDNPPIAALSRVVRRAGRVVGSIRFHAVEAGGTAMLLLGPLAVDPDWQGKGIGRGLIGDGLARARALGHRAAILVGDAPYYGQFGFARALALNLELPGWVDPARFLGLELVPGALAQARGPVQRPSRRQASKKAPNASISTASAGSNGI
ncbi:MAG: N-acetyltransferase [Alphaproteobacteria bacterium]|nr:N-acetyltransferase [Alphaproteobacteria bacterium]